jgi:glycosyltransferase involved in cell wall biosynthesis
MSLKLSSLTIFFPCYNEEANVERTTRAALAAGQKVTDELEVIIVNDGSKDRTGELADALAAQDPRVRAVHNNPNRGYGGALRRGFQEASKEWVFYTDGDGQFDLAEIESLIPLARADTIVSAYRLDRKDPFMRKINAFCWTVLVNVIFRLWLKDIDAAFKLYPRRLFDEINIRSTGALIDTEILARAKRLGYRIVQLGVHHYPRQAGQQTGANLRVIARAFKELFKLAPDILRTSRPASAVTPPPNPSLRSCLPTTESKPV